MTGASSEFSWLRRRKAHNFRPERSIIPAPKTASPCGRGTRTRALFVSGWSRRDRQKANLRKFRGYSSDHRNQKYEAISGGFVAGGLGFEPGLTESESAEVAFYGVKKVRLETVKRPTGFRGAEFSRLVIAVSGGANHRGAHRGEVSSPTSNVSVGRNPPHRGAGFVRNRCRRNWAV